MPTAEVQHYADGHATVRYYDSVGEQYWWYEYSCKMRIDRVSSGPLFNYRLKRRINKRLKEICRDEQRKRIIKQETIEQSCE